MKKEILKMAAIPAAMLAVLAVLLFGGCGLLNEEAKKRAHAAVIEYAETKGQDAVIAKLDQMVRDGDLTERQAQKVKDALPRGIEELKKVMGEIEKEGETK